MMNNFESGVSDFFESVQIWSDSFLKSKFWKLKLSLFCMSVIFFFNCPNVSVLTSEHSTWGVVKSQIQDPTRQYYQDVPSSHESKRTFRLSVPIIFKTLHIDNPIIIYAFQLILELFFFFLIINFCEQYCKSGLLLLLVPLSFCFLYLGQVGVVDVYAKFDSIAIFGLLLAMSSQNPLIVFCSYSLAAWTDERAIIVFPLVYVYIQIVNSSREGVMKFFIPSKGSLMVILALASYILLRLFLTQKYQFVTATGLVGISVLLSNANMYFFGLWTLFEGYWLVVIAAFCCLCFYRKFLLIVVLVLATIPGILAAFLVVDISRSLIYTFPLLLISLKILSEGTSQKFFERLVLISVLISILVPTYFAEGAFRIEGNNPLIFKMLQDWIFA